MVFFKSPIYIETHLEKQLEEARNNLLNLPTSIDELFTLLDRVETLLANVQRAPSSPPTIPQTRTQNPKSCPVLPPPTIIPEIINTSTTLDLKRKTHPDFPHSPNSKKPKFDPPIAKASSFDPKTVTIIPQSQLSTCLKEQRVKRKVRKFQFGGYHLPVEDQEKCDNGLFEVSIADSTAEEAGLTTPPWLHENTWLEQSRYL
jgi:hypothetical protein